MFFNLNQQLFQNILTPGCSNVLVPGDNDINNIANIDDNVDNVLDNVDNVYDNIQIAL